MESNEMRLALAVITFLLSFCVSSISAETFRYVEPLNSRGGESVNAAEKYECYRCNRYKGGGNSCPETLKQLPDTAVSDMPADTIVRHCEVCMKVTTVYAHRNRDYILDKLIPQPIKDFEDMQVVSRTCIEDKKDARLTSGCLKEPSLGGYVERCYCQGNLCNTSTTLRFSVLLTVLCAFITVLRY